MRDNNTDTLLRRLKPMNVWALAFGCVIGWGAFVNPGKKFLPSAGVYGTGIAMILGALIMIIIAYSYSAMTARYPKAGGEFTFTKVCFGKKSAYWCGWFLVAAYLTNVPMNSTAIGLIVHGLFGAVLRIGFHYRIAGFDIYAGEMIFAAVILILLGVLSIKGVRVAGAIQTILAGCLAVSVILLTIAAITSPVTSAENMTPLWGFDRMPETHAGYIPHEGCMKIIGSILAMLAIAPWAFVGFDTVPQAAEEFKFPVRKVNLIMVIAIMFGGFVYVANNTITAAALEKWPELIINSESTPWLLLAAAEKLLGLKGKIIIGTAVFSAVLTGILGFYMASSRLIFSMSRDGYLPEFLGRIDSKHGTPKNAIIFCMIISLSGPVLGREALGWFVDMSAIGASIGYAFTCMSAIITMKRSNESNHFLEAMAFLGACFSFMFMVLQLVPVPGLEGVHFGNESYIMLAVWLVIGAVFYAKQSKHFTEEL